MAEIKKRPRFQLVLDEVSIDDRIYITKDFDVFKNDNWLPLIYAKDLKVKETIETTSSAVFLDSCLKFDTTSHFFTGLFYKRDDVHIMFTDDSLYYLTFLIIKTIGFLLSKGLSWS